MRFLFKYIIIVLLTFAALQSVVVVMHEFTHSTVAWLFGDVPTPRCVIWGNPLLMTGWDEGVHYSKLFPSGRHAAEAIIGGSPLLVHTIIVVLGILFLKKRGTTKKKYLYHKAYPNLNHNG